MTGYWTRIVLGALAVFGIGMGVWFGVTRAKEKIEVVVESAQPITVPIPFSILPFKVDGNRVGRVHHVTFHRDTPKSVEGVVVQVNLADSIDAARFENCLFSLEDVDNIDEHTTFDCMSKDAADTAGLNLVRFGDVRLDPSGMLVPLLLPAHEVADLRHTDQHELQREEARMRAEEARWAVDSLRIATEGLGDSISQAVERLVDSLMVMKKVMKGSRE